MTAKIKHYLLTIDTYTDLRLHCYLISDDPRRTTAAADKMIKLAEDRKIPLLMIVLETELSPTKDKAELEFIRGIISRMPEAKQGLRTATDFHITVWGMQKGDPDDARLMELH
jgi:hypothetical protein